MSSAAERRRRRGADMPLHMQVAEENADMQRSEAFKQRMRDGPKATKRMSAADIAKRKLTRLSLAAGPTMDRTAFKQFLNSAAREFDVALMSQISDLQASARARGRRRRRLRARSPPPFPSAPSPPPSSSAARSKA